MRGKPVEVRLEPVDNQRLARLCGALDENLKFYLMARGIPEPEAESLLVQAFVGDAVEGIEHAGLRDALMEHVVAWLKARG